MKPDYMRLHWGDSLLFLNGIGVTIGVTLASLLIGSIIGTMLGLIRSSNNKLIQKLPLIYMEPLRNTPVVAQLFLIYFGLPQVTRWIPTSLEAAVLTMSLNTGAFFAVLVNSSIRAIPQSQWEAGLALGHSKLQVFYRVILRQALRVLIPPTITLYIGQLQMSAFVSLVGLRDVMKVGMGISQRTYLIFLTWGIVLVIYYLIAKPMAKLADRLERTLHYSY